MRKTEDAVWEGRISSEGYILKVELKYHTARNGYVIAEVIKTLHTGRGRVMKWTDFGGNKSYAPYEENPPVWMAEEHFKGYVAEAKKIGFQTMISGKPEVRVHQKWIPKYQTEVRQRRSAEAWRDERSNAYAGMEVEA
ncbi:hypothetical protein [Methanorbis rubei]|uniref:Uncharacterized protein n=1 Tax=Methanorbis rubei TaxID=3028300 RepID=A0AAE4MHM6_9EURY|nr:hypothetical protein [Methanocorpusculaceae archaeon Cs1]